MCSTFKRGLLFTSITKVNYPIEDSRKLTQLTYLLASTQVRLGQKLKSASSPALKETL